MAMLHLPPPLGRIIPSQDSQFVLVPSRHGSVSVVSTWTLKETARLDLGVEPDSIGLALFQSVVTIISQAARKVILYDLRDEHRIADIALPGRPGSGAVSPDGSKLYVTLPDTGEVAVINLTLRRIGHIIDGAGAGVSVIIPAAGNGYCH
jgi:DNA-binding beta-propeller fold protein YncE